MDNYPSTMQMTLVSLPASFLLTNVLTGHATLDHFNAKYSYIWGILALQNTNVTIRTYMVSPHHTGTYTINILKALCIW